jgi:hypothetical protein
VAYGVGSTLCGLAVASLADLQLRARFVKAGRPLPSRGGGGGSCSMAAGGSASGAKAATFALA